MKMRYLIAWFVMLVVAMINGTVRDFTYGRQLPALLANQLSCVSGIMLFAVVIYLYVRRWPPVSARQAWYIGLFWTALTVAFEFLFFHYVAGHPWDDLLENYDIVHGRLWPLILLWVAVAPYVFYRLAGKRN
jgi:hypothetical protein